MRLEDDDLKAPWRHYALKTTTQLIGNKSLSYPEKKNPIS